MPPRFAYWTILAGGLPTAFRAADRNDLAPTFERLKQKHPDAVMKWFARGRLWDSPDDARAALKRKGERIGEAGTREKRGRDWRPGGTHRDPRQRYLDAKKARNAAARKKRFERRERGFGPGGERQPAGAGGASVERSGAPPRGGRKPGADRDRARPDRHVQPSSSHARESQATPHRRPPKSGGHRRNERFARKESRPVDAARQKPRGTSGDASRARSGRSFERPELPRRRFAEEPPRPDAAPPRQPRPGENPEPTPPPRPGEPAIIPPGPPEQGRARGDRRRRS